MGVLRSIIVLRIKLDTSNRKKCTVACIVAPFYRSSMAHACCHRLIEVVGQNRTEPLPLACRACASCGAHRDHMATQPSSGPSASPVAVIFAPPCLHASRGLPSPAVPSCAWGQGLHGGNPTWPSQPLGVPVLSCSETVNHPELLTGFMILNRAWTQLSRGESIMSYCNSFYQPILSWT